MSSPRKRQAETSHSYQSQHVPIKKVSKEGHSSLVADHYNKRGNTSCAERRNSKIYYMRNFNNWIKSVLIRNYLEKVRQSGISQQPTVLDLGVGKGGDLLKWDKGNIKKLICTDIAETSITQCKERYNTLKQKSKNRRIFDAEFIVADLSRESLHRKFSHPTTECHISSCQFVVHYTFESEAQAEMMVRNACSFLKEGGYFIGTTINDEKLMGMASSSPNRTFGNDVYSVEFSPDTVFSEFGCKYIFKLHGVVDCPEFLLRKHTLIRLCKKHGMRLVEWKPFAQFFEENCQNKDNYRLIRRMQALEIYPSQQTLNSSVEGDYSHAEEECNRITEKYPGCSPKVATLSKTEWEAASLYVVYAFVKDQEARDESELETSKREDRIPLVVM